MAINLRDWTDHNNIAEELDEEVLLKLGSSLCAAIGADDLSREKWLKDNDKWLAMAQQVSEAKTYPWPGASNIQYPTLSIAAIQFHAQALPALLGNKDIVKCRMIGGVSEDKLARAIRVSRFMSTQFIDLIDGWVDDMDRLLLILAIVGLVYKKSYYSQTKKRIVSEMISARDVIVNYNARNYERARITHRIYQDSNEMFENTQAGIFLDVDLSPPSQEEVKGTRDKAIGLSNITSEDDEVDTAPRELYESHCWLDLDEDGYKEPYIVTLDKDSRKILRIVARWDIEQALVYGDDGQLIRIEPSRYFTAYKFLPDPESAVYGLGFGRLLGPSNSAVNALINMLMDAGHMETLGGGFISRGIRVTGGAIRMKPNEWVQVQSSGDDLRKGIVPRPTASPSPILYQLLGLMINAGKDLSTVQDIFMGKNPGQNQPYATTKEVVQQGLKVFNAIYKRIYRQMSEEFSKVYLLNNLHLAGEEYEKVLDDPEADKEKDFALDGLDIIPSAEPDMIQEQEKILKANALIAKKQAGIPLNTMEVTKRVLEAEGHENIEALMEQEPSLPNPDVMKIELETQKFQHQQIMDQIMAVQEDTKIKSQAQRDEANAIAVLMNATTAAKKVEREAMMSRLDAINKERDQVIKLGEQQTKILIAQLQEKGKENAAKTKDAGKTVAGENG